jgi:hypothetical protein
MPIGNYSTSSAYTIPFVGSFADYEWEMLWKSKAENKCKLFCWFIMQNKLWTADRFNKHGEHTNAICQLCRMQPESTFHMMAHCSYSEAVWTGLSSWLGANLQSSPTLNYRWFKTLWNAMIHEGTQNVTQCQERVQKLIYMAWNISKEYGLEHLEGAMS